MPFLDSVRSTLIHHVQPFLEAQWEEQKRRPAGSLGTTVLLIELVATITSQIGIPKPLTTLQILDGSCLKPQKVYEVAKTSLVGISGMGAVIAIVLLIKGLPGISLVIGLLSLGTLAGAYMAHEAATQRSLAESIEEVRTQAQAFERNNQELRSQLTQQNALFMTENAAFRENITHLEAQNTALRGNIDTMTAELSQFALQNQHYCTIANDFRGYLEQFRSCATQDREELTRKLDDFNQQISASGDLWRSFSNETNIFRQNYATQLTQLRELICQITDSRSILARLQEHRELQEQIQTVLARLEQYKRELSSLDAEIALRDGQLRQRDELLGQLRSAHEEILSKYQHETTTLGLRNDALEGHINQISSLIDRHFGPPIFCNSL